MRYFVQFSYRGTNYHGWQHQPNAVSVQDAMELCFSTVMRCPVSLTAAGRTDTGVHAAMMVAHFDVSEEITDTNKLTGKLNSFLPPDIAIQNIRMVTDDAHARFSATSRTYRYYIVTEKNPFENGLSTRTTARLDFQRMNQAATLLLTNTDFASFCKVHTDVKTTICKVTQAYWSQLSEHKWVFTITADRFLRDMVRAIVGTLFEVGRGKISLHDFQDIISKRSRTAAASSAPADGLYLTDIQYPENIYM